MRLNRLKNDFCVYLWNLRETFPADLADLRRSTDSVYSRHIFKKGYLLVFAIPMVLSFSVPPPIIKAEDLVKRFTNKSDTTYVINFWATWCGPCVKELPYFEKLNEVYLNKKIKVLLVSIDFVSDRDSKLTRFVKRKKLKSEVLLLNETKPNEFIDKIDKRWNGSIPATLIVNNAMKYNAFFEREVTYEFLESKVKALAN